MKPNGPTPAQAAAIGEKHKTLLVAAAAGSGKTWTLTERIIEILLDPAEDTELSELLIVTFTTAAAAELRERIAKALRHALEADPQNDRLSRQLLSVSSASIYTIDAFCNEILRRNTAAVGLPAGYRVPDTAEVALLAASVMETTVDGLYDGTLPDSGVTPEAFASLADCLTDVRGEEALGQTLLALYRKAEPQEEGIGALRALVDVYTQPEGAAVEEHPYIAYILRRTAEGAGELFARLSPLSSAPAGGKEAVAYGKLLAEVLPLLQSLTEAKTYARMRSLLSEFVFPRTPSVADKSEGAQQIDAVYATVRAELRHLTKLFFAYTEDELVALFPALREKMQALVDTLCVFDRLYRAEKRRLGLCEYADMERYAYECLWQDGRPTEIAEALRAQYKGVYIDEYQDVNRLQDRIFAAISTEENRFMVGDIKQSIYGFRSADPTVFADMKRAFPHLRDAAGSASAAVYMSENFRCDRTVIDTVNEIFDAVFGAVGASIGYLPEDRLICAKPQDGVPERPTELLLVERASAEEEEATEDEADEGDEDEEQVPLRGAEAEAYAVADRIRTLLAEGKKNDGTPFEPRDIALLFRAAKTNIPVFSRILSERGIPCRVTESLDFFLNADVLLALCLLNAIDNPSKDVYLAGLLCSPLFGFTPDELVRIRRSDGEGTLFRALTVYTEATRDEKCRTTLDTLAHYRKIAEGMPMDALLFRLYRETGLLSLATQHGGRDNLLLLYNYARTFERSSFRGLYAFISYVNRLIENRTSFDRPSESDAEDNAVRLMSVHASKGLEFPAVFLCGCATTLRNRDGVGSLIYAQEFGIGMRLRDKTQLSFVDNPAFAVIAEHLYETMFEEELRVLYVALTRAREQLVISGYVGNSAVKFEQKLAERCPRLSAFYIRRLRSYLEIVCATAIRSTRRTVVQTDGSDPETVADTKVSEACTAVDPTLLETLTERFAYRYPNEVLCTLPEKLSVSVLYPTVLDGTEEQATLTLDEAEPEERKPLPPPAFVTGIAPDDSAERGIATHMFLQFCDFARLARQGASEELRTLVEGRFLSEATAALVRTEELELFCKSPLIPRILAARRVLRELRFHAKLPASLFTADEEKRRALEGASLLVQGIMDCVIEEADGSLLLIDYKTDRVRTAPAHRDASRRLLADKHRRQLTYYAKAAEQIFGKAPSRVAVYSLALGECIDIDGV